MAARSIASGYNRRESPTQTKEDAVEQVRSREVWGRAARGGAFPCVKAYRGPLASNMRGIEFTTPVAEDPDSSSPNEARWYYPKTNGVFLRARGGEQFAAIPADVVNKQP